MYHFLNLNMLFFLPTVYLISLFKMLKENILLFSIIIVSEKKKGIIELTLTEVDKISSDKQKTQKVGKTFLNLVNKHFSHNQRTV